LDENESGVVIGREIFDYEAYRKLAQHPRVVGIGECGLDYYRLYDTDIPMNTDDTDNTDKKYELIKQQQREAFLLQIKLAKELDKVLVIHCRPSEGSTDAYSDLFEIITNYQLPITNENQKPLRFEIHSFTGSWETAEKFLELGGFLGFNGIITFDKTGVAAEVVKKTPMNRILLETDSPYLAPVPFRGKRNTPLNVEYIAQKIAEIKGLEYDYYEVARQTSKNASVLFHLNLDWPLDSL
jgi:TatD DNase family protein